MRFFHRLGQLASFAICTFAQTQTEPYQERLLLILKDSSRLVGRIVEMDTTWLVFETAGKVRLTIPRAQVSQSHSLLSHPDTAPIPELLAAAPPEPPDPLETRLMVSPSARTLRPGEFGLTLDEIFFLTLGAGITRELSLYAGISWLYTFGMHAGVKVLFLRRPTLQAAVSGWYARVPPYWVAALQVPVTIGTSSRALTLGLGLTSGGLTPGGLTSGALFPNLQVLFGGEVRISRRIKFITDNFVEIDRYRISHVLSAGFRITWTQIALQLYAVNTSSLPLGPWITGTWNFGNIQTSPTPHHTPRDNRGGDTW